MKMAICGHQFHGGDESDWVLSTSAGCLEGSTTAGQILRELFKTHCRSMSNKTPRKRPKTVIASSENNSPPKPSRAGPSTIRKENENLIVKKIAGTCTSFDDFDESQHLNGCPVKWLYNKKLLEKSKTYKVCRPCYKKSVKKEEVKKERNKNLRDKTPIEVKIHKINLIEKYTNNCDDVFAPYMTLSSDKPRRDPKDLEIHRRKLAAKLNWKLHDDSHEDRSLETSSEVRHNYLPPRPLLGLKPLLSVLLAPHQETNCCSIVALRSTSPRNKKMEASLTIQSLDLPFSLSDSKLRPRTTNALRWGKSSMHAKKLQIPNPITIKLEEKGRKSVPKSIRNGSPAKKLSERAKQTKSLTSLFYELKGKTTFRHQNEKYFEEMIQDLTMEEGQFKIKRFFNMSSANSDLAQSWKNNPEKRKKLMEVASTDSELNLVCERVRFFEKKSSRGRDRETEREEHSPFFMQQWHYKGEMKTKNANA